MIAAIYAKATPREAHKQIKASVQTGPGVPDWPVLFDPRRLLTSTSGKRRIKGTLSWRNDWKRALFLHLCIIFNAFHYTWMGRWAGPFLGRGTATPHTILSLNILFKRHGKSQDISHEHTWPANVSAKFSCGHTTDFYNQWKVPAILLFYKKINSATWKEQKN